jgi:hypothetical protein
MFEKPDDLYPFPPRETTLEEREREREKKKKRSKEREREKERERKKEKAQFRLQTKLCNVPKIIIFAGRRGWFRIHRIRPLFD